MPSNDGSLSYEEMFGSPAQNTNKALTYEEMFGTDAPSRTAGQIVGDVGSQLAKGVNTIAGAIPNLLDPSSPTSKFFNDNAQYWQNDQSQITKSLEAAADARIKEAAKTGQWEAFKTAVSEYGAEPALVQKLILENIPSMIPGLAAAKGAQVAAKGSVIAGTAAGAGTNSVLNAGGARQESYQDIKKTLMERGMPEAEADAQALDKSRVAAGVGAATGALSGGSGLERGILGGATGGFAKRAGVELGGEQLEEVAPTIATNMQLNRGLMTGVGETSAKTLIASSPGSVISGFQGNAPARPVQPPQDTSQPTPDITASSNLDDAIAATEASVAPRSATDIAQSINDEELLNQLNNRPDDQAYVPQPETEPRQTIEIAPDVQPPVENVEAPVAAQAQPITEQSQSTDLNVNPVQAGQEFQPTEGQNDTGRVSTGDIGGGEANVLSGNEGIAGFTQNGQNLEANGLVPETGSSVGITQAQVANNDTQTKGKTASATGAQSNGIVESELAPRHDSVDRVSIESDNALRPIRAEILKFKGEGKTATGSKVFYDATERLKAIAEDTLGTSLKAQELWFNTKRKLLTKNGDAEAAALFEQVAAHLKERISTANNPAPVKINNAVSQTASDAVKKTAEVVSSKGIKPQRTSSIEQMKDGGWRVKKYEDGLLKNTIDYDVRGKAESERVLWERGLKYEPIPLNTEFSDIDKAATAGYKAGLNGGSNQPNFGFNSDEESHAFNIGMRRGLEDSKSKPTPKPKRINGASAGTQGEGNQRGAERGSANGETQQQAPAGEFALTSQTEEDLNQQEARAADTSIADRDAADRTSEVPLTLSPQSSSNTGSAANQGSMFTPDGRASKAAEVKSQTESKPAEDVSQQENINLEDLNSGRAFVNGIKKKIAEWVASATQNGKRPLDRNWERNAVKRFTDTYVNPTLSGKQYGNRAASKIAVAKSETFAELEAAIEKFVNKTESANKAPKEKPISKMSPADLLRAAAAKMDAESKPAESNQLDESMRSWELDFGMMGKYTYRASNQVKLKDGETLVASTIYKRELTIPARVMRDYGLGNNPSKEFAFRVSVIANKDGETFAQVERMASDNRQGGNEVVAHFEVIKTDLLENRALDPVNNFARKFWEQYGRNYGKQEDLISKPTDPISQMAASVESLAKSVQALVENQDKLTENTPKFVRRGDFWNYSGNRVAEIAKVLDLTVTSRDGIKSVGIPDYARDNMERQLRDAGINAEFETDVYKKSENLYTSKERVKWIDIHADLFKRIQEGEVSADEFKASFDALLKNKDGITAELEEMTKPEIFKRFPDVEYRYKNEKKDKGIAAAYRDMITDFTLGASYSYGMSSGSMIDSVRAIVERTTDESLAEYADKIKRNREERAAKREEVKAGMDDPVTLEDYQRILAAKAQEIGEGATFAQARMAMPLEQRIKFDELAAEFNRSERARGKAAKQEQSMRAPGEVLETTEIIKTKHTKHGHDLWQFNLVQRVSGEEFKMLAGQAKRLGGDYSSYRGNGAIPGWQFRTEEAAKAFKALVAGDASQAKDIAQTRRDAYADDRSQSATERLNEMADKLDEQADTSLNQRRKENTHRRAEQAARAETAARSDKALAQTMRNIANAIEDGSAKFLDQIRQKVQVETLRGFVNTAKAEMHRKLYPEYVDQLRHKDDPVTNEAADYLTYPAYTVYRSDLANIGRALLEVDGTKKLGQQIMKVADDVSATYLKFAKDNIDKVATFRTKNGERAAFASKANAEEAITRSNYHGAAIVLPVKRGENLIILSPSEAIKRGIWEGDNDKRITLHPDIGVELVEKMGKAARRGVKISVPWQLENAYDMRKRLAGMNIETPAELRAAVREFIELREVPKEADKIKQLERAMIGSSNDGMDFFPTPANVADEMVQSADIREGMSVLEPSAGMGHIADRIRDAGVEPDVAELSGSRRELLEAKGYNIIDHDFMDVESKYDRIIMNPPFGDRRDAMHVQHAYSLLNPGGRVVAIVGEGVFFGKDAKAQEFRDWLEKVGGTDEKLDQGTFLDPSLPVNTGVSARMVVIDKGLMAKSDDQGYIVNEQPSDTININGIERPRLNSNGKPIANSDEALRNFWEWFSDSAVVDEQGRPLVMHHGGTLGENIKPFAGMLWLAENKDYASSFAEQDGGSVVMLYASIKNSLDVSNLKGEKTLPSWRKFLSKNGIDISKVQLEDWAPEYGKYTFFDLLPHAGNNYFNNRNNGLIDEIKNAGFDGIKAPEETTDGIKSGQTYVAFDSTNIKSAIGNNGNFSNSGNNILRESINPYENLETRPNTTDAQLDTGREALAATESRIFGNVRSGLRDAVSLLGSSISSGFREKGGVSLLGQKIESPADLAILAQVMRDPRFETFRIFYTDEAGKIVGEAAYSSRLPGAVYIPGATIDKIASDKKRFGASGYWMLHNHPSGSSAASKADLNLTEQAAKVAPGFLGHVIIDHDEYSHISVKTQQATSKVVPAPWMGSYNMKSNPEKPHALLGRPIFGPRDLASVAKDLQKKDGFVVIFGVDAQNRVSFLTEIPASALATTGKKIDRLRIASMVRRATRETGVIRLFAGVPGKLSDFYHLTDSKLFADVVELDTGKSARDTGEMLEGDIPVTKSDKQGSKGGVLQQNITGYTGGKNPISEAKRLRDRINYADERATRDPSEPVIRTGPSPASIGPKQPKPVNMPQQPEDAGRALGFWMRFFTRNQIVSMYQNTIIGKQLKEYKRLREQITADTNQLFEEADSFLGDLRLMPVKLRTAFADLAHQSTLHGVDPANAKYVPSEDAVKLDAYIARNPSNKKLAAEAKASLDEMEAAHKRLRAMYLALPDTQFKPGVTARSLFNGLRQRYVDQTTLMFQAFEGRVNRMDIDENIKESTIKELKAQLKTLLDRVYFPLYRSGDFILRASKAGEQDIIEHHESERERNKHAKLLRAAGYVVDTSKRVVNSKNQKAVVASGAIKKLIENATANGTLAGEELKNLLDEIDQTIIKSMPDTAYRRAFIHRKGTAGYSDDFIRAYASSMRRSSSHIANLRHGDKIPTAIEDMRKAIKTAPRGSNTDALDDVVNRVVQIEEDILIPTGKFATAAGRIGFAQMLGSLSNFILNATQTYMITLPHLGGEYGYTKTMLNLAKANADQIKAMKKPNSLLELGHAIDMRSRLSGNELELFKQLHDSGKLDLGQVFDLIEAASNASENISDWKLSLMKFIGLPQHISEVINRQVTALAAIRLELARSGSTEKAYEAAKKAIDETHFDYSKENRAKIMSGDTARVVLMFKQYAQNYMFTWGNTAKLALIGSKTRDSDGNLLDGNRPSERKKARKQLAGLMGTQFLAAGALGLPIFAQSAVVASGMVGFKAGGEKGAFVGVAAAMLIAMAAAFGDEDDGKDFDTEMRLWFAKMFGPTWGEVLAKGIIPLGMSSRLDASQIIFRTPETTHDKQKYLIDWAKATAGAFWGGTVANDLQGTFEIMNGNPGDGAKKFIPVKQLKDFASAWQWAHDDMTVKNKDGEIVSQVSKADVFWKAVGVNPSSVVRAQEFNHAKAMLNEALIDKRKKVLNRMIREDNDKIKFKELMEYNKQAPLGYHIEANEVSGRLKREFMNKGKPSDVSESPIRESHLNKELEELRP